MSVEIFRNQASTTAPRVNEIKREWSYREKRGLRTESYAH